MDKKNINYEYNDLKYVIYLNYCIWCGRRFETNYETENYCIDCKLAKEGNYED